MKIGNSLLFVSNSFIKILIGCLLTFHISSAEQILGEKVLIGNKDKHYSAEKLVFQPGFKINAFDSVAKPGDNASNCSKDGKEGDNGKNAGNMTIEANEASGTLSIDLTGQNGGKGGNGATGCRGSNGTHETPRAYKHCKYDKHFEETESKTFTCDGNRGSKHCTLKQLGKPYTVSSKKYDCNHRKETYKCNPHKEKYGCYVTKKYLFLFEVQKWDPKGCTRTVYDTCERTIYDTCTAYYQCTVTRDNSTIRATQGKTGGKGGDGGHSGNGGHGGNITLKFRDQYDLNITLKCAGGAGGVGGDGGDGGKGGAGGKGYYYSSGNTGSPGSPGKDSKEGKEGHSGSITLRTLDHNYTQRQELQIEIKELEAEVTELKKIADAKPKPKESTADPTEPKKTTDASPKTVDLNQYPSVNLWLENSNKSYYRHFDPVRHIDLEEPAIAAREYQTKINSLLDEERINSNQARLLNDIRQEFMSYLSEEMMHNDSLRRLRKLEKQLQKKQDKLKSLLSDWRSRILKCSDMPPKISSAI